MTASFSSPHPMGTRTSTPHRGVIGSIGMCLITNTSFRQSRFALQLTKQVSRSLIYQQKLPPCGEFFSCEMELRPMFKARHGGRGEERLNVHGDQTFETWLLSQLLPQPQLFTTDVNVVTVSLLSRDRYDNSRHHPSAQSCRCHAGVHRRPLPPVN